MIVVLNFANDVTYIRIEWQVGRTGVWAQVGRIPTLADVWLASSKGLRGSVTLRMCCRFLVGLHVALVKACANIHQDTMYLPGSRIPCSLWKCLKQTPANQMTEGVEET